MPFMLRQLPSTTKLGDQPILDALASSIPLSLVQRTLGDVRVGHRHRKLPAELTLLLPVAMALFPREAMDRVLVKLLRGLRFLWPDPGLPLATKSAICQARYRLGARPLALLFHRVCRPLATLDTPGAFAFGLRLVALDSTVEDLPDTPANRRYFGSPSNQHGLASFPQARGVYLVECGTHAFLDAGFWPITVGERVGGRRLLRSVAAGMLLLWDRGFHSADLIVATLARGAHMLGRLPSYVHLPIAQPLPDGSYLAHLSTGKDWQRTRQQHCLVRVIEYTLTDPNRPGAGERHRLVTTVLDPAQAPALDLIDTYHARWEVELVIDELKTHQRLLAHPLRSQKPVGVIQELYGLLLAHVALRAVMAEAAAPIALDPRRLSFVHALQLIRDALPEFQMVLPAQRSLLYARLLADIRRYRLPPRANRIQPRVVKRTRSKYPPKRPQHRHWPQPAIPFRDAIALLI